MSHLRFVSFTLLILNLSLALRATAGNEPTPFEKECQAIIKKKSSSPTIKLHELFDLQWKHYLEEYPEQATYDGFPGQNDRWTDYSLTAIAVRKAELSAPLKALAAIDRSHLSEKDQLNYDLFRYHLERELTLSHFPAEYLPVNQLEGVQQEVAHLMINTPHATEKDYHDILSRLQKVPVLLKQTETLMREGLKRGYTPPKITLREVPNQIKAQLVDNVDENPILLPFRNFPSAVPAERQKILKEQAAQILKKEIIPAFQQFYDFFVQTYLPKTRETISLASLPEGAPWYLEKAHAATTTDLTPRQIHEIGLSEVARLHKAMESIIQEVGYKGSFEDFLSFLRSDSRFFFEKTSDLVTAYRDIAKRIDPNLVSLFGKLPRLPYGVLPAPSYAEKSWPTGYYEPGSLTTGRAGYFYANTYLLSTRPKWEMEPLVLHEAVPGHHLQIALALEMKDVPEFRRFEDYTAFVEGWGLYAESLGADLGMYRDPYARFGQLAFEMWRSVRLVVDTGIHSLSWTREQAIAYFKKNTPKTDHDIEVEVDRYIVWPGQALAYKMGGLTFQKLRKEAETTLGDRFDIRRFHDEVLKEGALPLPMLETRIDSWIQKEKEHQTTASNLPRPESATTFNNR